MASRPGAAPPVAAGPGPAPGNRWPLGLLLVAAVAAAVYVPTLGHGLVWDDNLLVAFLDGRTRSGGVSELLTSDFRLYPREPLGYYGPVAMLSLWFDRLLSGVFPYAFHLTNVLLHAAVSALVASSGRLLTVSPSAGLLGRLRPLPRSPGGPERRAVPRTAHDA